MSEAIIAKLQAEWDTAAEAKDFKTLGKILRMLVNVLKSVDSGIKENEDNLAKKVSCLEDSFGEMEFKTAIAVIGDVRHARKSLKVSSGSFGSAFKVKLDPKERARIRKRSRPPRLNVQNGVYDEKRRTLDSVSNGLQPGDVDDDEA